MECRTVKNKHMAAAGLTPDMSNVSVLQFPTDSSTLPEGFWSAVDVWIKKPHVLNKRLCGVTETLSKEAENVRNLLDDVSVHGVSSQVLSFLSSKNSNAVTQENHKPVSRTVRTFVPKVNSYGTRLQKEVVVRGKMSATRREFL